MAKLITESWLKRHRACPKARMLFRKAYPNGVTVNKRSLEKFEKIAGKDAILWLEDKLEAYWNRSVNKSKHLFINGVCQGCKERRITRARLPKNQFDRIVYYAKFA